MKTICLVAMLMVTGFGSVYSQSYFVTPRHQAYGGGFNVRSSDGRTTGTITQRHHAYGGGYDFRYNDGTSGTITKRHHAYGGGYEIRFRGADGKSVLFESDDFAGSCEDAWIGAVEERNVLAMTEVAWNLRGIEMMLGKADAKTSSTDLFRAAAQVAVEQHNGEALVDIVALCPECKEFEDDLKAATKSRGQHVIVTMPRVLPSPLGSWDPSAREDFAGRVKVASSSLMPWERLEVTPDLVCYSFAGTSLPDAQNVAMMINRGRRTCNAAMIGMAAVSLSNMGGSELEHLDPKWLLEEAAGLAVTMADKQAIMQIKAIYENMASELADAERARILGDELKMLSGSRGRSDPMIKSHPGQFMKPKYVEMMYRKSPDVMNAGVE